MKKLEVIIASMPDREKVVAEIWDGEKMIAEVNQEPGYLALELYANGSLFVQVDYELFLEALIEAKASLVGGE